MADRPDLTAGRLVIALLSVLGHDVRSTAVTDITITSTEVIVSGASLLQTDDELGPRVGPSFRITHPIGWEP